MHDIFNASNRTIYKNNLCKINTSITNTCIIKANIINTLYLALLILYTLLSEPLKLLREI